MDLSQFKLKVGRWEKAFWEHSPLTQIMQRILLPHKIEVTPYTVVIFKMCSTLHEHRERDGLGKKT